MNFEQIYFSLWHQPFICFIAIIFLFTWLLPKLTFTHAYLLAFGCTTAIDAFLSSQLTPIPKDWQFYPSVFFIILGDARFFLLLERYSQKTPKNLALRTFFLSIVVPIVSGLLLKYYPATPKLSPHWLYLFYELFFILFASLWWIFAVKPRLHFIDKHAVDFCKKILGFFLIQYKLWALADVLILLNYEWGYGVRLIPNIMYYALFLVFVAFTIPAKEGRERV